MRLKGAKLGRIEIRCSRCNWKGHVADDLGAVICPKCMLWIPFIPQKEAPVDPARSTRAKSKEITDRSCFNPRTPNGRCDSSKRS